MATAFDEEVIQLLAEIDEVDIETRAGADLPAHRTTIWVVVDGDAAYVRSVRGTRGRWYREATAYPEAVLHAGTGCRARGFAYRTARERDVLQSAPIVLPSCARVPRSGKPPENREVSLQ